MNQIDDLSGNEYGIWKVLHLDHIRQYGANHKHGMSYYACKCQICGQIKLVARSHLMQNKNKSHRTCKGCMS